MPVLWEKDAAGMTIVILFVLCSFLSGWAGFRYGTRALSTTKTRLLEARSALELETAGEPEPKEPYDNWRTWFGEGEKYGVEGCVFGVYYQAEPGGHKSSFAVNIRVPFHSKSDNRSYADRVVAGRAENKKICKALNGPD